jgi:hypothetical protein
MIDILCLQFCPTGRDAEAIIPLVWYLQNIFGYSVKYGSMFDAVYLIDKYRPKMLLLNNIAGSEFNVKAADYAYNHGVKVISLTSEGLFKKEEMDSFIWGNNKNKKINWHKLFVWSERFLALCHNFLPRYKETFDVSGSTGIDFYKLDNFVTRKKILEKYNKNNYKKVIVYAGFSFSYGFDEKWISEYKIPKEKINFLRTGLKKTKKILLNLIVNNPNILFILKKHPGEVNFHMEIEYDWKFKNIIFLENQEQLCNLINISDIYMVFESTSSFEAYALNKHVINLFPVSAIRYRHEAYKGNCLVKNYIEAQKRIDEFFKTGKIKDFLTKEKIRKELIKNNIANDDGLNSWRTAKKIDLFIKDQKIILSKSLSIKGLLLHGFLLMSKYMEYIPRIKNSYILMNFNTMYKLDMLISSYDHKIRDFYNKKIKGKYV